MMRIQKYRNRIGLCAATTILLVGYSKNDRGTESADEYNDDTETLVDTSSAEIDQAAPTVQYWDSQERPDAPQLPPPSPFPFPVPTGDVLHVFGSDAGKKIELAPTREASGQSVSLLDGGPPVAELNLLDYPPFRAEYVELGTGGDTRLALVLAGAESEPHRWKPALDFRFPSVSEGNLKVTFDFFQASYDAGTLNLQAVELEGGFNLHQRMRIANDFVHGPKRDKRIFQSVITAGSEARWHRIEWTLPLPQETDSNMSIALDGETEPNVLFSHNSQGAVDALRMFLHLRRNADIVYYIDNVLIERLP